jgi:hypothetical protein
MKWRMAAMESRKSLSLAAVAVVLCLAGPVNAGEEVHFSDSSTNLPPSTSVKTASPLRRLFDIFLGHNNSMGPVVARPFMPMEPVAPRPLTPRERQALDQKKNWMFNDAQDAGISDKSAAEAFHVRGEQWGETSAQTPSTPGGSIVRYVEKSRTDQTSKQSSFPTPDNEGDFLNAARSDLSPNFKDPDLGGPAGMFSTRGSSLGVDSSASYRAPSDQSDSWSGRVQRALMDSFTSTSGNSGMGQSGPNRTAVDDLFSTRSVVGNALANDMSPARNLADPLSLSPDRTKEALNPVVGSRTSDLAGSARFGEVLNNLPNASGVIRSRLDGSLSSPAISSSEGTFKSISAPQPSRIQTTPLVLDVPRRTF